MDEEPPILVEATKEETDQDVVETSDCDESLIGDVDACLHFNVS